MMKSAKFLISSIVMSSLMMSFAAHADDYRVCPSSQTEIGIETVREACGSIVRPEFDPSGEASLDQMGVMGEERDAFRSEVAAYSQCVTAFINSYRRPGADASSTAPDEAACVHAWAQDQLTESIREFGRACYAFNDQAMISGEPQFSGSCYPTFAEAS